MEGGEGGDCGETGPLAKSTGPSTSKDLKRRLMSWWWVMRYSRQKFGWGNEFLVTLDSLDVQTRFKYGLMFCGVCQTTKLRVVLYVSKLRRSKARSAMWTRWWSLLLYYQDHCCRRRQHLILHCARNVWLHRLRISCCHLHTLQDSWSWWKAADLLPKSLGLSLGFSGARVLAFGVAQMAWFPDG